MYYLTFLLTELRQVNPNSVEDKVIFTQEEIQTILDKDPSVYITRYNGRENVIDKIWNNSRHILIKKRDKTGIHYTNARIYARITKERAYHMNNSEYIEKLKEVCKNESYISGENEDGKYLVFTIDNKDVVWELHNTLKLPRKFYNHFNINFDLLTVAANEAEANN